MEAASITHEHHGPPPAHRSSRVPAPTLGMLLFIISEVMIFGAFFTAYFFIRVVTHDPWPAHGTKLPEAVAGINTAILLSSSLTIQINEYIHIGFAPQDSAQGTIFYSLTGLHGAHVLIGLCALAIVTIRSFRGHYSPEHHEGMEVPGIYWHFVDIMWVIVYTTVYVL